MKKPGIGLLTGIGIGLITTVGVAMAASGGYSTPTPLPGPVVQAPVATSSSNSVVATSTQEVEPATEKATVAEPVAPKKVAVPSVGSEYYTNVDGNQVHVPVHADSAPAGASAQCRDGSYSFSQNRRGTCSHHGGVSLWL